MTKITTPKIMLWAAAIFLVALGFVFLWLVRSVLFLLFVSLLLATGIEPLVNWLRKRGPFSRSTGTLAVYLLIFGVLGLILFLAIPPLIDEGQRLVANFSNPDSIKAAINNISNDFIKENATRVYENAGSILANLQIGTQALSFGLGLFEVIFSTATALVIAFYWINEKPIIKRYLFSRIPQANKEKAFSIWENVEIKLGAWMRGQLFLMVFIGVLAGIGYTIMGVKFAFALAVFAGLTELIPIVGPYLGGAPAVLVALTQSLTLALIVVGYIVVLQLVEGNVLVPRVMESQVGVSALTVIVGVLMGTSIGGIGGALLAVPIAASLQVLANNVLSYTAPAATQQATTAAAGNTGEALNLASLQNEKDKDKEDLLKANPGSQS